MLLMSRIMSPRIQILEVATRLRVIAPAMTRITVLSEAGLGIAENSLWYATIAPMSFRGILSTVLVAESNCMKFAPSAVIDILHSIRYATSVGQIERSIWQSRGDGSNVGWKRSGGKRRSIKRCWKKSGGENGRE